MLQTHLPQEPLVIYPNRQRLLFNLAVCLLFALLGYLIAYHSAHDEHLGWYMIGWMAAIFFGAGAIASLYALSSRQLTLILNSEGFEFGYLLSKRHFYRWSDVTGFNVGMAGRKQYVVFNFSPDFQGKVPGMDFNRSFLGVDHGLTGNFGMNPSELADLLNSWRTKAVQKKSPKAQRC